LSEVPVPLDRRRVVFVFSGLMAGLFLSALDQNVVSTALPTIVGDLGGATHLSWVVTAYLLTSTVSVPLWGKLGDLYGRKRFFQAAILIFLLGSVLAGLSNSMGELIASRAVQGLGGGGLLVGAQAIIGDIVAPRDRGRYVGLFAIVFGVATVLGPLIGGLFVEYWNWRWVFFINLPVGILALAITTVVLPGGLRKVSHTIDYLGISLLSAGVSALVVLTSLGGSSFPWSSPWSFGLGAFSAVMLLAFVAVERQAREPVFPLHLFTNRAFAFSSGLGFVVGLTMFGTLVFMPLFLQIVMQVSPTQSGFRLIWLMGGYFLTSMFAGQVLARGWRYRPFPIVGTALMTLGLFLMSLIGVDTPAWQMDLYMVVFGVGLGAVMQVLILVVQNSVPYEDLGVATSGATFFRSIGGSFGTAVFGAIFTAALPINLHHFLPGLPLEHQSGFMNSATNPQTMKNLSPEALDGVRHAVAATVQSVFRWSIPMAVIAFFLALMIPENKLRSTMAGGSSVSDAMPQAEAKSSSETIEQILTRLVARENRVSLYANLAERAQLKLGPQACWLLFRIADNPGMSRAQLEQHLKIASEHVLAGFSELEAEGLVLEEPEFSLSAAGREAAAQLHRAREAGLRELLEGWDIENNPELEVVVRELATSLLADDDRLVGDLLSK